MPMVETQGDFNIHLASDRLKRAKKKKELEDTIRKIVREEHRSVDASPVYEDD